MSATTGWGTGTRPVAILGVGLLLALAWVGGRMSAGGAAPFGMMGGGMHGKRGLGSGPIQSGEHVMGESVAGNGGTFEAETGLQRCRAMMGTMAGMHRSMQSMMGGDMMSEGEE